MLIETRHTRERPMASRAMTLALTAPAALATATRHVVHLRTPVLRHSSIQSLLSRKLPK